MLKRKIISYSKSPWSSPIVIVPKKDEGLRFCVDYRALNAVTKKDVYPLPNVQDSLDALSGSQYFTTLDMNQGYWQIAIADEDKEKTAFTTGQGLYEFEVMPFGITNAPATFQRTMEVVFSGLKWIFCLVYLDDIIIFSKDFDEHLIRLQAVLDRIDAAGLTLNPKKCHFVLPSIKYLGQDKEGQRPDPEKVRAVKQFPTPKCIRDIRSFVSLGSYYRKFVPNYSSLAEPLTKLTR